MHMEVRVPTLGESMTEATIGRWFKSVGDAITQDEALLELETDKVTMEVPAPVSGTLVEVAAASGTTVEIGALLGRVEEGVGAIGGEAKPDPALTMAAPRPVRSAAIACGRETDRRARPGSSANPRHRQGWPYRQG